MNTKTTLGLLAAIVIIVIAFFVFHKPAAAPVALPTATTTPAIQAPATSTVSTTSNAAAPKIEKTITALPSKPVAHVAFDQASLVTSSSRPTISGTATNVTTMALVIDNPQGVGIVGSGSIPVVNGHWSYTPAIGFSAGTYAVHILGNGAALDGKLVVTQ